MKHNDYFTCIDPNTTEDAREYVFSALRLIPDDWQGYDVTFSQYGLAKMLIDLGHARLAEDGTIVVQSTAGHTVYFTRVYPYIGLAKTSANVIPHYAVIVPAGILIGNTVYRIK